MPMRIRFDISFSYVNEMCRLDDGCNWGLDDVLLVRTHHTSCNSIRYVLLIPERSYLRRFTVEKLASLSCIGIIGFGCSPNSIGTTYVRSCVSPKLTEHLCRLCRFLMQACIIKAKATTLD
jgi:hypothetical protein